MPRFSEFLSRPRHDDSPHDDIDRSRRALIGAGGVLMLGAALWPLRARAATDGKLKIGVIGSGHIGGTIGGLWVKAGHPVLFSSRHPDELKGLVEGLGPLAQAGTVAEAIAFGNVVFIAVPYGALPQLGQEYGAALKGKIVLDACNATAARDGAIADEVEKNGIGVTSQKYLPGTRLVRAFNTLTYMIFAHEANRPDPKLGDPDRRRRCRRGDSRGRAGARRRLRSGGGRQARRCEPLPARRAGLRPERDARPNSGRSCRSRRERLLARHLRSRWAVPATPQERAAALWSFAYFFTLLAGYYVLRPLRDQMGIAGGVRNLPWLFTATFVTLLVAQPLYGALVAKLPRARFIPVVYHFFVANLAAVLAVADARCRAGDRGARVLRLGQRVQPVRGRGVLVVHGRPLQRRAGQAAVRLHRRRRHGGRAPRPGHHHRPVGAARPGQSSDRRRRSSWNWRCSASTGSSARPTRTQGAQRRAAAASAAAPSRRCPSCFARPICSASACWVSLLSFCATILYFEQANIVAATVHGAGAQTRLFAGIDLAVSLLSLATQIFATGQLLKRFGTGAAAAALPAVYVVGFLAVLAWRRRSPSW